jgi:hypothetical protein
LQQSLRYQFAHRQVQFATSAVILVKVAGCSVGKVPARPFSEKYRCWAGDVEPIPENRV